MNRSSARARVICPICGADGLRVVFHYDAPPKGETIFEFSNSSEYRREIHQCASCGHFVSRMDDNLSKLYEGQYVEATYGKSGLFETYSRIMALPVEKSDNYYRVQRIIEYTEPFVTSGKFSQPKPTVLDVGSGLCVFLKRMKSIGWLGTALDPDQKAVDHALSNVGVEAVCGDFMLMSSLGAYDLITFNKVLEHVEDPVAMLSKSHNFLNSAGMIYIELPDGQASAVMGKDREEFYIEHLHIFSLTSLGILADLAGFTVLQAECIHEPSDKYTVYGFLAPKHD